jgi:hypothetical protein
MEPVTDVPDDLELSLLVLTLFARELANFESFDPTFETRVCSSSDRNDVDSLSSLDIEWMGPLEIRGYDGSFGLIVELLDGGGSYAESLCIADPEGELGPMLGSG